jgi:hypothetical protein
MLPRSLIWKYLLGVGLPVLFSFSLRAQSLPTVRGEEHHDVSQPLRDLIQIAPKQAMVVHEAEPARRIPLPPGLTTLPEDPVRQRTAISGPVFAPVVSLGFEGLGNGQYGFSVTSAPPDTNGAVGATQYVQWVNTSFAIFNKSTGALVSGPTPGNTLWSGFGGGCQSNNDGDPIVLYDKLANRWVFSQFSVTTTPYLQCIAVSTTSDATGTYNRYSFQYNNFDDYPKMGVWPDAYYETFNMFNGNNFVGTDACAYDRNAMLNGTAATQICFQQGSGVGGVLPADLDGTTPPPAGSPNYMLYFGTNSLNLFQFHVNFTTPSASSFTGPTVIPVAAFTPLCNGGTCVPQPGTSNQLDSLADRLMYRLAYRNFGNHESLVVNQSVVAGSGGGIRWYEIQNPSGTPTVAQQSTFAPDSNYRWMGSIAMDKSGDIAVGYSVSSSSLDPSIRFAGRIPTDPTSTLEAETNVVTGTGVQNGGLTRWGDYSAMSVDPVDDCTFWYTQEYIKTSGSFNWNTRIANFKFSNCGTSGGLTASLSPSSLTFASQTVGTTSPAQPVTLTNNGPGSLTITSIATSGDYAQSNNCGSSLAATASCTINVTFKPTATGTRTGTLTVADNATNSPQTTSLTGTGTSAGGGCTPNTLSNGGFETGDLSCWTAGGVLLPKTSTVQKHSGTYSALLGGAAQPEPNGDSSIYQTISVPSTVSTATLTFWYWPSSTDTITYDWQEAQVRNTSGAMLAQIFKVCSNAQVWTQVTFNLTPYKGQTIQLYFNAHGDGYGDLTYMYLDDVSVTTTTSTDTTAPTTTVTAPANNSTVSGTTTVTATGSDVDNPTLSKMEIYIDGKLATSNANANSISYSWNTTTVSNGSHTIFSKAYDAANNVGTSPTITVTVSNTSTQLIQNGGFETGTLANWTAGGVYLPFIVTGHAHSGTYSSQLGASSGAEPNGDSSLYQTITVPSTASKVTLTFWYWPSTTDTITYDWQEAQVRNSAGTVLAQIMRVCSNAHAWTQVTYDLTSYKGQTIRLYFNTHQDGYGDLTYMYLDDVSVTSQ